MKPLAALLIAITCIILPCAAKYKYPIGETAVYKIQWGPMTCGTSTITCKEVIRNNKKLIRIRVRAESNWMVSTIYPVDDTVDCYIDPRTNLSVLLEKKTSEGGFLCTDTLKINRTNNIASWVSASASITTNYPVLAGSCDAVSFLYSFREHQFKKNETRDFNLVVDTAVHGITIKAGGTKKKKIGKKDKVLTRKFTVKPKRDDLFVRKIPLAIWITEDARKIMTRMDVKTPAGTARIVLDKYTPAPKKPATKEADKKLPVKKGQ